MDKVTSKLTVFFDDPFWVGVYECAQNGKLEAARVVFGAEPRDYEVYEYFIKNWKRLRFSPPIADDKEKGRKTNPKRMQRAINQQLLQSGIGTKAQQALKLQQEQNKLERKSCSRQKTEEEKQRIFELRQQKKKEKHNGK